ncbi:serine/threonine kinase-like domain-containing protein STKLD1 isoform X2 [Pogoniulus pusillus]|uniref:serine/threonine kinase-like domain-containing protein STKLD1 isoform X2 n=1 Tax=Pogoniulus pusillus TaxID=488313 RepID=UPI0030B97977
MEKYEVLEQLQPGALGSMLVVALKTEEGVEKKYIIKQVECIDETQANEALKEAVDLLQLQHSNICAYKELFVTWDSEISSVFLCLVMQHSGQGDLSAVIEEKRQKAEKITDMVVMKFLGQMVDALFYIHKQNIFHRNLKPSNILVTGEASFMLSDFSTAALMRDEMKWKRRVEENSKAWMAPETFLFSFTEKSDIWSLGCVLLDMMTCLLLNAEEITSLLQAIREDPGRLEGVLTLMQEADSSSVPLLPVLSKMLQVEPSMRPTAEELTDVPFIRKCLTVAEATSVKLKRTLPPAVIDMLLQGGVESVLEFMQFFQDVEAAQVKAIQHLASLGRDGSALPCLLTVVELTTCAMRTHLDSLQLQVDGCRLLLQLLSQALEQDVVVPLDENVTSSLVETVRKHSHNQEFISLACRLLMLIATSETAAENLWKVGVIPDLLSVVRCFLPNGNICLSCCGVLWSLAVSESADQALLRSAVPVTAAVLQEHLQNGAVAESACSALWALSLRGCLSEDEFEPTTVLLLDALRENPGRAVLVKNVCLALASLLRLSEIPALRLVTDSNGSGINLLTDTCHLHFHDPQVVETICMLMNEMVQYDDVLLEMLSLNMEELLSDIKSHFPSSMEIRSLVDATLLKLQKYK